MHEDLRRQSAAFIAGLDVAGCAVGGVGLAVAAGIALRYLLAPVSRLAQRRVHR